MTSRPECKGVRFAAWFLALSYGLGAPLTAYIEYSSGTFSERFGYPSALIYLVCAAQVVATIGLFSRAFAAWAAAGLTAITLGAIVSHVRIGSPVTALPAVFYTALQVWFGLRSR